MKVKQKNAILRKFCIKASTTLDYEKKAEPAELRAF